MEFDNQIIFRNISYLIKKQKKKVGELEEAVGVSAGYISRTSKDSGLKPGIDFIMRISKELGVSIDLLVNYDLTSLSGTQVYIYSFLDKLDVDTKEDKLNWTRIKKEKLNNMWYGDEGVPELFCAINEVTQDTKGERKKNRMIFESHSFGSNTWCPGDLFRVSLDLDAELFILHVGTNIHGDLSGIKKDEAVEIWLYSNAKKEFICSNKSDTSIRKKIDTLISSVMEYVESPIIPEWSKSVIDRYMDNR